MGGTVIPRVPKSVIQQLVKTSLAEDIGHGDRTARLVSKTSTSQALLRCRESAILCGQDWFNTSFRLLDKNITCNWHYRDGEKLKRNDIICELHGKTRAILTAERAALNFLQLLSGTATLTRHYIEAIGNCKSKLLDTRKTIPGLQIAQKYAVRCGGGNNHRLNLNDQILIKENHIVAIGDFEIALKKARKKKVSVEVEVESMDELKCALRAGATRILLDNFNLKTLRQAVSIAKDRALLEASGNVTLKNIKMIAKTGVDFISVGDITKTVRPIDFSLRLSK